ncbi:MAG: hypothetical protein ACLR6J_17245 [Parabacteroides merdae]
MVVCYNEVTCVRMYNYVRNIGEGNRGIGKTNVKSVVSAEELQELKHEKLEWMQQTEITCCRF